MWCVVLLHSVVTAAENRACMPILNFRRTPQFLPKGITLGSISPSGAHDPLALTIDAPQPLPGSPDTSTMLDDPLDGMIATDLSPSQSEDFHSLLASYCNVSDFSSPRLGQTSLVAHRIDTGNARPIHRRPY